MANYKVLADNSTLGAPGTVVTDDDLAKHSVDAELLIASKIIEPANKTTKDKE